jgi:predicted helicase
VQQLPLIGFEALAHEAAAVNKIKRLKRFTVVIGNPPYSNFGQLNKIPHILGLLEDYKRGLDEKKFNITDDFIKFVKLAQHTIDGTRVGVVGMITNNVFIDGLTHRRMRQSLIESFPACFTLDLHGSVKKQDVAVDGSKDENVFDIQQGVAISLWAKSSEQSKNVRHCSYRGTREYKYKALSNGGLSMVNWTKVEAEPPQFFFCPSRLGPHSEYLTWIGLKEIFVVGAGGLESMNDALTVSFTKADLSQVVIDLHELPLAKFRSDYKVEDSAGWRLDAARSDIRSHKKPAELLRQINYRPFDIRWTFFSGNQGFLSRPRFDLFRHLIHPKNIGLCAMRQSRAGEEPAFFAIRGLAGKDVVSALDRGTVFPLFLENESSEDLSFLPGEKMNANFTGAFIQRINEGLQRGASTRRLPAGLPPEDIFHYASAVFHSPVYRSRYAEFLKIDFPRLPLTGKLDFFRALARLGGELTVLHLLESPKISQPITRFISGRNPEVEKVSWSRDTVWVDKAQTTGFQGVREEVWNFHIGGYQVCEKWLKDRKGRTLSTEDIAHYQKVVVALSETIRLMAEIDEVIEKHGGWPGAFSVAVTSESTSDPAEQQAAPNNVVEFPIRPATVIRTGEKPVQMLLAAEADWPTFDLPAEAQAPADPVPAEIELEEMVCKVRQVLASGGLRGLLVFSAISDGTQS